MAVTEEAWPHAVHMLNEDPVRRAALRHLAPALGRVAEERDAEWAHWIGILVEVLDDEPFVGIEISTRAGRLSGVVN